MGANFPALMDVQGWFKYLDKNNGKSVSMGELRILTKQFVVKGTLTNEVIEWAFKNSDIIDDNGRLNYEEFVLFHSALITRLEYCGLKDTCLDAYKQ